MSRFLFAAFLMTEILGAFFSGNLWAQENGHGMCRCGEGYSPGTYVGIYRLVYYIQGLQPWLFMIILWGLQPEFIWDGIQPWIKLGQERGLQPRVKLGRVIALGKYGEGYSSGFQLRKEEGLQPWVIWRGLQPRLLWGGLQLGFQLGDGVGYIAFD